MILKSPCCITSRLLPGVVIGEATISIERDGETRDNRDRFRWYVDIGTEEYTGNDLHSGVGGCLIQSALESLLSFLGAFAESWQYSGADGEHADLFPSGLADWAMSNSDEIGMAQIELSEGVDIIAE